MKKTIYTVTIGVLIMFVASSPVFGQHNYCRTIYSHEFYPPVDQRFENTKSSRPKVTESEFKTPDVPNAAGDLDPTWGNGGVVVTSFSVPDETRSGTPRVLLIQPDGKIIVSGHDAVFDHTLYFIGRYNPNGTLDTTFGTGGKIVVGFGYDSFVLSAALQPDGKIVVGLNNGVARYNPNGTFDTTFGIVVSGGEFTDIFVQPDGKIITVGHIFVSGSNYDFAVVRYNPNGTLDTAFGTGGKVITAITSGDDFVERASAALQPDGKIVVGGFGGGVSNTDFVLVRYNSNGTLDSTFGTDGKVITAISSNNDNLYDIALQADGKIIAVGSQNFIAGSQSDTAIVRYNPNGSIDTTFATNGIINASWNSDGYYVGNSVVVQPNGKILAFGYGNVGTSGAIGFAMARYNANGLPDATFGNGGRVVTQIGNNALDYGCTIALQPDGKIIAAGKTGDMYYGVAIVRYLGDSPSTPRTRFDFDGDGKADVSVFRPSNGTWYLQQSQAGFTGVAFGQTGDKITPADYDGDGKTDVAVYRGGTWYLQRSSAEFTGIAFGAATDIPVPADFDGDGRAELVVYRPSNGTWYFYNLTNNQTGSITFGASEDKPVPADYDGDGKTDVAVFRPSNGTWYLQRSQLGFTALQFGEGTDKPVPADYDGDGKADLAVFRAGTWYLLRSAAGDTAVQFGLATDIPVPADYDGDGKTDIAVFRDGTWYLQRSQAGFTGVTFGSNSDVPLPSVYLP